MILLEHPNSVLTAKIDCEGAEYQIIESLHAKQKLGVISLFMIEWHGQGPDAIVKLLCEANFAVLSFFRTNATGMIYAYNSSVATNYISFSNHQNEQHEN
jgi:hypothetical protein